MSTKSVALCLRGFELPTRQVESIVGVAASELGTKGEPVKPGVQSLLKRSYVRFSVELPSECRLDEVIPILLERLGGVQHLCDVRDQVAPEFVELDMTLAVKGSDEQEGGFLPPTVLADLSRLQVSLSFQFV